MPSQLREQEVGVKFELTHTNRLHVLTHPLAGQQLQAQTCLVAFLVSLCAR